MAFTPVENRLGIQPIAQTNVAKPSQYQIGQSQAFGQAHPLGTIVKAYDPTYGEGEFIYLEGCASTVVGSIVTYNNLAGSSALASTSSAKGSPVAVAMSANVASQYGWYQIGGVAVIAKTATKVSPGVKIAVTSTAGEVAGGSVAGAAVFNALTANAATVASATGTVAVTIDRPFLEPIGT